MKVPFVDLARSRPEEDIEAIREIVESGRFVGGQPVADFEQRFAEYCDNKYCVSVNSGTDALFLTLLALGIGKGDEVITVPNTFIATIEAIAATGATTTFVDIDPDTYLMEPSLLADKITERTKAIIPVHLYGQLCDMEAIYEVAQDIPVVEDACQAHGIRWETECRSIAKCYSFYPSKPLGCYGDGGAAVTDSNELAQKARALRNHGELQKSEHLYRGFNSRLDTIQAGILLRKLPYLDKNNESRREAGRIYVNRLSAVEEMTIKKPVQDNVYHLLVIETEQRDRLRNFLGERGVQTGIHYPKLVYQQPAFSYLQVNPCPNAERIVPNILSLPIFANISEEEIGYTCTTIEDFYA